MQGGKLPCGPDEADEVLDAQGNLVTRSRQDCSWVLAKPRYVKITVVMNDQLYDEVSLERRIYEEFKLDTKIQSIIVRKRGKAE